MRNSLLAGMVLCLLLTIGCRRREAALAVLTITTPGGVEMVALPTGQFRMGSDDGGEDERPIRMVRISAFQMDVTEVTQKSFEELMGSNPSRFRSPDRPVERLSWSAAARYCNARSLREGLRPCYNPQTFECDFSADGYRLPTEAEWEYACRANGAGNQTLSALSEHARYRDNSGQSTQPVGKKQPNAWGLFDMLGNVAEWCNDYYAPTAYAALADADPRGPSTGDYRVLRGGSWRSPADQCRPAARFAESPGAGDACLGYEAYGFRCVRRVQR